MAISFIEALSNFIASLLGVSSSTPARQYTAQGIKSLVYATPPEGMAPDFVFAHFALEIGIENFEWKPGQTFLETRSLSNRHVGSGKGFWTGDKKLVIHTDGRPPEELRIYDSPEQSLQDFAQLMRDPLYVIAAAAAKRRDRKGYFQGLTDAGYDKPDYAIKLENRYQALKARGII